MLASEREKLLHMEEELHKRVVGQEQAIAAISDAVRRSRAGLNDPRKPIGSFIFLGTTGVGKTELAKALAEFLFNDDSMLTRIDMSEYQERHSVSRLVGAPPGYVGYDEGGQLTEAVRRKPYSVVLLDEIEKAHPDVFNILLQVLDDGRLTDNKGRTVDFRNTIIIMTSNMGSQLIQENFAAAFNGEKLPDDTVERTRLAVIDLLKQQLKPEFLNRIDEIVMFEPLTRKDIEKIVDIQLGIVRRMLAENGLELNYTPAARAWIAEAGYDPMYGARPVKRTIQREVVNDLSKRILAGEVDPLAPDLDRRRRGQAPLPQLRLPYVTNADDSCGNRPHFSFSLAAPKILRLGKIKLTLASAPDFSYLYPTKIKLFPKTIHRTMKLFRRFTALMLAVTLSLTTFAAAARGLGRRRGGRQGRRNGQGHRLRRRRTAARRSRIGRRRDRIHRCRRPLLAADRQAQRLGLHHDSVGIRGLGRQGYSPASGLRSKLPRRRSNGMISP